MSQRTYIACRRIVNAQHSNPPNSFLDQLIDAIDPLPDSVFEENSYHDIYSVMLDSLGPYNGLLHRKAVMCEVLRVQAAFESDWHWDQSVDGNNGRSLHHKEGEETGAFQVSWDSLGQDMDGSLRDCLNRLAGSDDVLTFIREMKSNHALAVEYCARLLRFSTSWCGTINTPSQAIAHVRRDAVAEFQGFLHIGGSSGGPGPSPAPAPAPGVAPALASVAPGGGAPAGGAAGSDLSRIPALMEIPKNPARFEEVRRAAAKELLEYDGEVYPRDGCAITLSDLLQAAGIPVPDTFQAITLGAYLRDRRHWTVIANGDQQPGDIGSTCGETARHGEDHIYLVIQVVDKDQMIVADNQKPAPHPRYVSGKGGKTPTKFFLRAT